jgi:hypothetical protein
LPRFEIGPDHDRDLGVELHWMAPKVSFRLASPGTDMSSADVSSGES